MDFSVYWFMFPACIVIASIAMLSGISGAAMLSPAIILGFPLIGAPELAPAAAIGMSLFTEFFGFGSGVIAYLRRGLVDLRTYRALVWVAVPVAALAGFVSQEISPTVLKGLYGVMMFPLALVLFRQAREELRPGSRDPKPRYAQARDHDPDTTRVVDRDGKVYEWRTCNRRPGQALTALGATMTGLVSTGIGEIEMPQLVKRCHIPLAIAAGTSILVVASTVLGASVAHISRLMSEGGVGAVPWNLVVYTVPGAIIGGQIGARLQGSVRPSLMERSMALLFAVIGALFLVSTAGG